MRLYCLFKLEKQTYLNGIKLNINIHIKIPIAMFDEHNFIYTNSCYLELYLPTFVKSPIQDLSHQRLRHGAYVFVSKQIISGQYPFHLNERR